MEARDRSQCGEATRAFAQAAIRSVGLIVQPGAKDAVSETRMRGYLPPGRAGVNVRMTEGGKIRYFAMFQSLWVLPKVEKRSYLPLYDLEPNTTLVARLNGVHPAGGVDQTRAVTSWTNHVLPSGSVKHENDL